MGARSSSLLRDLSLLPSLRAGAGRGRTGGGSKPSPAGDPQRSDGGGRDPGSLLLPGGRVNKVPGSMRRRDRAQGQWPCSRTRIRACWDGLGHLPVGKQRRVTAVRQPLGPHWVKLHRPPRAPPVAEIDQADPVWSGFFTPLPLEKEAKVYYVLQTS